MTRYDFISIKAPLPCVQWKLHEATIDYDSIVLEYSNPGPCVEDGGAIRDLGFFTRQLLRPSRLLRTSTFTIQICYAQLLPTSQSIVHLSFFESS